MTSLISVHTPSFGANYMVISLPLLRFIFTRFADISPVAAVHRGCGGRRPAAEGRRLRALEQYPVRTQAGHHQVRYQSICV